MPINYVKTFVLRKSLYRFVIVGTLGFCVNAIILWYLHKHLGWGLLSSQIIAGEVAIISNFFWHNFWTYDDAVSDKLTKRFIEFQGSSISGMAITTLLLVIFTEIVGLNYLIALAIAGGVAMFWNYFWSRVVIWRPKIIIED